MIAHMIYVLSLFFLLVNILIFGYLRLEHPANNFGVALTRM